MCDFEKNYNTMFSAKEQIFNGLRNNLGSRITVHGNQQETLPNTLSVAFDNVDANTLASFIDKEVLISSLSFGF